MTAAPAYPQALEQLYGTFAAYARPTHIDACPCCADERDLRPISTKALRALTPEDLRAYASSALFTVGGAADFKFLLPRLYDLAAQDAFDCAGTDPESLFGRVRHLPADSGLTPGEQRAVNTFLQAWWMRTLETPGAWPDTATVLVSALNAGQSLRPLLDAWLLQTSPTAAAHLAQFIKDHAQQIALGRSFNAYLKDRTILPDLHRWLSAESVALFLEQAFFKASEEDAQDISDALLFLGR
ncbi:hypothetical protein [Deinococcus maricopensis]|uniref:Uncharacterized protein n=1 Tax=Deinococcus maricopensis (strain DSM 21211 / LMG 22137 / NRRL B-23946 / LB-34) TaxID=709986 RepID=E8U4N5_DEIML|nr:hypothetical protein [Deinococcus maricopensis]ADV68900.1 hypothetical protein Deima_3273 [Deinococcus maricopensis DSM 21211]